MTRNQFLSIMCVLLAIYLQVAVDSIKIEVVAWTVRFIAAALATYAAGYSFETWRGG